MTSSGSTPPRYLDSPLPATVKTDHRRAIDRYIDYFGDRAATGTEPLARRVTFAVLAHVEAAIRAVLASRRASRS